MKRLAYAIVRAVAAERGFTVETILGRGRSHPIVAVRWEVWRRLHDAGWSSVAIGRAFDRDHTTILHALTRVSTPRATPPPAEPIPQSEWQRLAAEIADLTARVEKLEAAEATRRLLSTRF